MECRDNVENVFKNYLKHLVIKKKKRKQHFIQNLHTKSFECSIAMTIDIGILRLISIEIVRLYFMEINMFRLL